jgi:hypothetical protein
MLEMAVTDRDNENVTKIPMKESLKSNEVFTDKVTSFEDDNFWEITIPLNPDESIEVAIKN